MTKQEEDELHKVKTAVNGNGSFGIAQKVEIMWKIFLLLFAGACWTAGVFLKGIFDKWMK